LGEGIFSCIYIFVSLLTPNLVWGATTPPPTPMSAIKGEVIIKPAYIWTLEEVLKIAENQNPDLKAAKSSFNAAERAILGAMSGYLPHIDIKGGFQQTMLPDPSAGLTTELGTLLPYTSIVGRVRQMIFDFGKVINDIGAARARSHSAEHEMEIVHDAVQLAAQKGFYNALAAQKLVEVAQAGVTQFEETLRRTAALVKAGTRPSFDLAQANVELSQAKLSLVEAINARDVAHVSLLTLLGMQKQVPFQLKDSGASENIDVSKIDLDQLSNRAIANRPEMKKSAYDLEKVRMQTNSAIKDYFPTISLEGWYGKYLPNYPTSIADSYGGGIVLSWSILDGLYTTSRVGELKAQMHVEEDRLEKQREEIIAEVAQSFADLKKAASNLALMNDNLVFAKENARLAKRRYESSVATFLELLVAQTTLLNAQAVAVQSRYQYETAYSSLKYAVRGPLF
jgi:outer membrane protein TolC